MSGQDHVPAVLNCGTSDTGPFLELRSVTNINMLPEIEIRTFGQQSFAN
jgi:hypothetical protein